MLKKMPAVNRQASDENRQAGQDLSSVVKRQTSVGKRTSV
jgi:hypothetical protein